MTVHHMTHTVSYHIAQLPQSERHNDCKEVNNQKMSATAAAAQYQYPSSTSTPATTWSRPHMTQMLAYQARPYICIYLSMHVSVRVFIYTCISVPTYYQHIYLSMRYQRIYSCVISVPTYLCMYQRIYLSTYPITYLFVYGTKLLIVTQPSSLVPPSFPLLAVQER